MVCCCSYLTYFVSLSVECMSERYHIWVEELLHDLQLSVFVPLILINFFDCHYFAGFSNTCLQNNELSYVK